MYPNSINQVAGGEARLSALPKPVPRPAPRPLPPARPRRPPGPPKRPTPRRPPGPGVYPGKPPAPNPRPGPALPKQPYDPGHVGKPGRLPEVTPGVKVPPRKWGQNLKRIAGRFWWIGAGMAANEWLSQPAPGMFPVVPPPTEGWSKTTSCLSDRDGSGYGTSSIYCGPQDTPTSGVGVVREVEENLGWGRRYTATYETWIPHPTDPGKIYFMSQWRYRAVWQNSGGGFWQNGKAYPPNWWPSMPKGKLGIVPSGAPTHPAEIPNWNPINPGPGGWPLSPPITVPIQRPHPWSPESPDVGPRPDGSPNVNPEPVVEPGPRPEPEPLPDPFPEVTVNPDANPTHLPQVSFKPRGRAETSTRPRSEKVRRPPRGTKERKVRANRLFSFLWNSISPITEGIDFINVMYECLPWKLKVRMYQERGRQPNPAEKVQIIYSNINDLDVGCALTNFIKEQIEDMIWSIGSQQIKKANQKDNRPIGYEAGGGISGGRLPPVIVR